LLHEKLNGTVVMTSFIHSSLWPALQPTIICHCITICQPITSETQYRCNSNTQATYNIYEKKIGQFHKTDWSYTRNAIKPEPNPLVLKNVCHNYVSFTNTDNMELWYMKPGGD